MLARVDQNSVDPAVPRFLSTECLIVSSDCSDDRGCLHEIWPCPNDDHDLHISFSHIASGCKLWRLSQSPLCYQRYTRAFQFGTATLKSYATWCKDVWKCQ